ncbi:MAG: hypothetical protein ACRDM1_11515 [Gaiellaceae bacterium]
MEDEDRVSARLERIEALVGGRAPSSRRPGDLLAELRGLVSEAEARARAESGAQARVAATKLRQEAEGMR